MGAFCCCCPGGGDEFEEYPSGCVDSICTHRICLRFFFHHFVSGTVLSLSGSGAAFTSSGMGTPLPYSSQNEAHYSFSRPLLFDATQRYSRLQRDGLVSRLEKSVTHFQEDMLPLRRNMSSSSVELLGSGKKWDGVDITEDSKLGHSESSVKEHSVEVSQGLIHIGPSSEEDDLCPTCLEEYTEENPKIRTKCSHHFHLGCIYEWMERSDSCPICGKETGIVRCEKCKRKIKFFCRRWNFVKVREFAMCLSKLKGCYIQRQVSVDKGQAGLAETSYMKKNICPFHPFVTLRNYM